MRDLTIIIPTYNMGRYLPPLLTSIVSSELRSCLSEIILVCDRSTDGSEDIIRRFFEQETNREVPYRLIELEERKGVYANRLVGARAATTEKILFLDSRLTLPPSTTQFLARNLPRLTSLNACAVIDPQKNIYNLYWLRSHAAIFWRRERDLEKGPIEIRPDNFDQYVVGTTGFLCGRSVFIECCESFQGEHVFSDDTWLMKKMSAIEPIFIHPDFKLNWEPRDRLIPYLKHLFNRGPGFAEYHVFEKPGALLAAVICGVIFLAVVFILAFTQPLIALMVLIGGLLLASASTGFLAKSFSEFVKLAPLHVAVMAAYGFGALRGTWVIWKKRNLKSSI